MAAAEPFIPDEPLKTSSRGELLHPFIFPDEPLKRSSSAELLPPSMAELRVVLLGGSWADRSSVGNFIFGVNCSTREDKSCLKLSGKVEDKPISVIITPDLQFSTEDKQTEFIKDCVAISEPGPHVFLLLLQPEDFTEEDKNKLHTVLKAISDRSFDHSLILILTPRQDGSDLVEKYLKHPPVKDLIKTCSYRYLVKKNADLPELLTRFDQLGKENNGQHVIYKECEETTTTSADHQTTAGSPEGVEDQCLKGGSSFDHTPFISALRVVLLEKSGDKTSELVKLMIREPELVIHKPSSGCMASTGEWEGKTVTVVNTPDLFSLPLKNIRREVKNCMGLCPPGPNVLLLLVNPSDFTEDDRITLNFILSLFGPNAFKHSMVIMTHTKEMSSVQELLKDCGGSCYTMLEENQDQLMKNIEKIVQKNQETFLSLTEETKVSKQTANKDDIPSISAQENTEKTSAAEAILGQTDLHPASKPSENVKHQGEVCGRLVSVVELPASGGKVMEESPRCVSLCDPKAQTKPTITVADKEQKPESLRIVLIGKTGAGKSSSGNTILERDEFETESSEELVTKSCEKAQCEVDGRPVVVVDTPALFDSSLSEEEVSEELGKCISLLAPGPHVFLLVIQIGRFTSQDNETLEQLKTAFGKNSEKFTIVLFTRGDELDFGEKTIEKHIEECDESCKKLISDCGQRYHVFNNYDKQNRLQVSELMKKIDGVVKENGGSCYTNDTMKEAEAALNKENREEKKNKTKLEDIKKEKEEKQKAWEREKKELKERRRLEDERLEKMERELKKLQEEFRQESEKNENQ